MPRGEMSASVSKQTYKTRRRCSLSCFPHIGSTWPGGPWSSRGLFSLFFWVGDTLSGEQEEMPCKNGFLQDTNSFICYGHGRCSLDFSSLRPRLRASIYGREYKLWASS